MEMTRFVPLFDQFVLNFAFYNDYYDPGLVKCYRAPDLRDPRVLFDVRLVLLLTPECQANSQSIWPRQFGEPGLLPGRK